MVHTFLEFTFLRSRSTAQVRNGFAELIQISTCSHSKPLNLRGKYCEELIETAFERSNEPCEEIRAVADKINLEGFYEMLRLDTLNLHEIGLDRVIAYGHCICIDRFTGLDEHSWSPMHELVPETLLRHGHGISIDMAYSATLADMRGLTSDAEHRRILDLFSRAGLSRDHDQFNEEILDKETAAILQTRDGLLRAAVPNPVGACIFLNNFKASGLNETLNRHKELMKEFPRNGEGIEADVDASDTCFTETTIAEA